MAQETSRAASRNVDSVAASRQNKAHRRRPDPLISTYLCQIRATPLLTRDEESRLAVRLAKSRRLFQGCVLRTDGVLPKVVQLLRDLQNGRLRFDRVLDVGVRDRDKKALLQARLSTNLRKLTTIVRQDHEDRVALRSQITTAAISLIRTRIRKRTLRAARLVDELCLRNHFFQRWWQEAVEDARSLVNGSRQRHLRRERRIRRLARVHQEAKRELARHNLRLVVSVAKRYQHQNLSFSDLIQEGNIGLMIAVDKFDVRRGHRFSTYATWWIMQMIRKGIVEKSRSVRLSNAAIDRIDKVELVVGQLRQHLGRQPTSEETDQAADCTVKESMWIPPSRQPTVSLDQFVTPAEDYALHESLQQHREAHPEDNAGKSELRAILDRILAAWEPRERAIIRLRFGLDDRRTLTLEEVGSKLRISRERVRQLEKASLARLREELAFLA